MIIEDETFRRLCRSRDFMASSLEQRVALVDAAMPTRGVQLAMALRARRPDLPIVLLGPGTEQEHDRVSTSG